MWPCPLLEQTSCGILGYWWTWERCGSWHARGVGANRWWSRPEVACLPPLGWLLISRPTATRDVLTSPAGTYVGVAGASRPTVEAPSSTPSVPTVEAPSSTSSLQHVLEDFPNVLNRSKVLPKPTHCMQHFLLT